MFGLSVPNYWVAILLIILFSATLQMLPAAGMNGPDGDFVDLLKHLVMPALATSAVTIGLTARTTRASIIETYGEDFVLLLQAKGLRRPSDPAARHQERRPTDHDDCWPADRVSARRNSAGGDDLLLARASVS